jgi:hypothetical protein
MRPFEGFQRKAIVIVPSDEEFKRRCEEREKEEGKDVPDSAVLEMKGGRIVNLKSFIPFISRLQIPFDVECLPAPQLCSCADLFFSFFPCSQF